MNDQTMSGLFSVLILLILLLAGALILICIGIYEIMKYQKKLRDRYSDADKYYEYKVDEATNEAKKIITTAKEKTNRFAMMSMRELEDWLCTILAQYLQVGVTKINPKDPDALARIITDVTVHIVNYIGEDNMKCIDTYFGDDFVIKWLSLKLRLIEDNNMIAKICDKTIYATGILNELRKTNIQLFPSNNG